MQSDITILLQQCTGGNREALDALTPIVYSELRKLAVSFMRNERQGSTLQPTALIHEACLQMRQLLVDSARRYRAQKRGGGNRAEMHDDLPMLEQQTEELLAVDEALDRLARQDTVKLDLRVAAGNPAGKAVWPN